MKILLARGDLRSNTGYSRALRAHLKLLSPNYNQIIGVDLHYHPDLCNSEFPWIILKSDHEINNLIEDMGAELTILNYCLPELFIRHPKALNVGLFYWETDRFNPERNWGSFINLMDEIWIPSHFNKVTLETVQFKGDIKYLPWPQNPTFLKEEVAVNSCQFQYRLALLAVKLEPLWHLPGVRRAHNQISKLKARYQNKNKLSLEVLRQNHDFVFLSVLQNVARKGINLTITEWLTFVKTNPTPKACLVLKVSPMRHNQKSAEFYFELAAKINAAARVLHVENPMIYLITEKLSDAQMDTLYRNSDALISTTLGEGFGGPLVEAALRRTLLIAPRHTSVADILPENWPLSLEYNYTNVGLQGQLEYYSLSSKWGIIKPLSLTKMLTYFLSLPIAKRTALVENLFSHCSRQFADTNLVSRSPTYTEGTHVS